MPLDKASQRWQRIRKFPATKSARPLDITLRSGPQIARSCDSSESSDDQRADARYHLTKAQYCGVYKSGVYKITTTQQKYAQYFLRLPPP